MAAVIASAAAAEDIPRRAAGRRRGTREGRARRRAHPSGAAVPSGSATPSPASRAETGPQGSRAPERVGEWIGSACRSSPRGEGPGRREDVTFVPASVIAGGPQVVHLAQVVAVHAAVPTETAEQLNAAIRPECVGRRPIGSSWTLSVGVQGLRSQQPPRRRSL
jgi:hypothetical protein